MCNSFNSLNRSLNVLAKIKLLYVFLDRGYHLIIIFYCFGDMAFIECFHCFKRDKPNGV